MSELESLPDRIERDLRRVRQLIGLASTNEPDDETMLFWRSPDLLQRGYVTNRQDLSVRQRLCGFPRPMRLGGEGRSDAALYIRQGVEQWI